MTTVSFSSDWGYYIDPNTFDFVELTGTVPVDAIVITKEWEEDGERRFVLNEYHLAKSSGVQKLDSKRDANPLLAEQIFEFMKKQGKFPPGSKHTKTFKNGNVEIEYTGSEYDVFKVKLTPKMIGGNVEDFIDNLGKAAKKRFTATDTWKVQMPTRSAGCKSCNGKVTKGQLRIGEPYRYEGHLAYKYHHLDCISDKIWGIAEDKIEGFDILSDENKKKVKEALWE
ncbi:MAG: PARP-type zinc finger-containing protein [Candidatus Thorarchaeota archaeon]